MNPKIKRQIEQMNKFALEGKLGDELKHLAEQNQKLEPYQRLVNQVNALYKTENEETKRIKDLFCQLSIVVYREAKRKDGKVASAILYSLFEDYPGVSDSSLYPKLEGVLTASFGLKFSKDSGIISVWEQTKNIVRAHNEFLNRLIGLWLVGWRCAQGKSFTPNAILSNYGTKVNEFSQLTGGDDGVFSLIFRVANPKLRNAITHGDISLDSESSKVRYRDGGKDFEMTILEFMAIVHIATHLPQAYLAAVAAIAILEDAPNLYKKQLPTQLVKLFNFASTV